MSMMRAGVDAFGVALGVPVVALELAAALMAAYRPIRHAVADSAAVPAVTRIRVDVDASTVAFCETLVALDAALLVAHGTTVLRHWTRRVTLPAMFRIVSNVDARTVTFHETRRTVR
jgi:hypothetical protein